MFDSLLPAQRRALYRDLRIFADGRLGEVFINGERPGSGLDALAHDASIILSVGLQHGADVQAIRHALLKDADGGPVTLVAAALSALAIVDIDEAPAS